MRLLLDEHHDPDVARQLRERGHDVAAVAERDDLRGRPDPDVFAAAIAERRAVVTENARDYVPLAAQSAAEDVSHYGVVITVPARHPRRPDARSRLVDALTRLLEDRPEVDDLRDAVVWLS